MANFLEAISSGFSAILSGLQNLLAAPIRLAQMIVEGMGVLGLVTAYVPPEILVFITAALAVSCFYLILGR